MNNFFSSNVKETERLATYAKVQTECNSSRTNSITDLAIEIEDYEVAEMMKIQEIDLGRVSDQSLRHQEQAHCSLFCDVLFLRSMKIVLFILNGWILLESFIFACAMPDLGGKKLVLVFGGLIAELIIRGIFVTISADVCSKLEDKKLFDLCVFLMFLISMVHVVKVYTRT
ncbi:hypothetical protein G9A89_017860 [Geosiphon pyriformis]|nr:hypothetical protein G9A89_017860 [Geosiphon pyriformis]